MMPLDREKFRQLVEKYLLPLFSGAAIADDFEDSTPRKAPVSYRDPCSFNVKPFRQSDYCVVLTRSQPFAVSNAPFVTEYRVTQAFVEILSEIADGIGTPYEQDLLSSFTRRVVVRSICSDKKNEQIVLATIDQLNEWSTRLYEGQPISAAVGFVPETAQGTVTLAETWRDDYSAVLTNGFDTLLVSNYDGWVQGYEALTLPTPPPPYAPHRLAPIAEWTGEDKMALALNRTGEILVIRNKQLSFARRGGRWHFLTHDPVITQMKCPQDHSVRQAVYASCLDASFARTGACVGIMTSGDVWCLKRVAPKTEDHIQEQLSPKAKLIRRIVGTSSFQQLDRRMRQELLAIDGATIIDHKGSVLAVGTILQIAGGSTGGGRLAAAIALSKYGTGIKVSQDGTIKGFYRCKSQETAKPAFLVM
jgi:hypothetical protein